MATVTTASTTWTTIRGHGGRAGIIYGDIAGDSGADGNGGGGGVNNKGGAADSYVNVTG